MDINITQFDENCILYIVGEIDLYNAYRLKDAVNAILEKKACPFIFNLRRVTYIDSSGIGALLSINATLAKKGIPFRIVDVPPYVWKVMELTRLVSFLPVEPAIKGVSDMREKHRKILAQKTRASSLPKEA